MVRRSYFSAIVELARPDETGVALRRLRMILP
jgi:hypothetical protein